jgi:hypothetical protein
LVDKDLPFLLECKSLVMRFRKLGVKYKALKCD